MISARPSLLKGRIIFHLLGKKLDHVHLKKSPKSECELYLKQSLAPPEHKISASSQTIDLPLKLDGGSTIPISRDNRLHTTSPLMMQLVIVLKCLLDIIPS